MKRSASAIFKLLDLRSQVEQQAQCRLAASLRENIRQQDILSTLRRSCDNVAQSLVVHPGRLGNTHTLLNNHLHLTHLEAQTNAQSQLVRHCATQEQVHREGLLRASRDRQIISRLTQRRQAAIADEQQRRENRSLDESATMAYMQQRLNDNSAHPA